MTLSAGVLTSDDPYDGVLGLLTIHDLPRPPPHEVVFASYDPYANILTVYTPSSGINTVPLMAPMIGPPIRPPCACPDLVYDPFV
jgi:hypothetical protein